MDCEECSKAAGDPVVTHVTAGHPSLKRLQDTVSAVEAQRAAEVASGEIKWQPGSEAGHVDGGEKQPVSKSGKQRPVRIRGRECGWGHEGRGSV